MRELPIGKCILLVCAFWITSVFGAAALAEGADGKVEIAVWHVWDAGREEWVQRMLDDFMEAHPHVEAVNMLTTSSGMFDRLTLMLSTGTAPEIVMVNSSWSAPLMAMGGLLALDASMARAGIDPGGYHAADISSFRLRGQTYALPFMSGTAWTNLMFTNRRLMGEAGLDADAPPATWSEWREASLRMTRADSDGRTVQGGTDFPVALHATLWNGAELWSDDWRQATVDDPRVLETTSFLRDLLESQYGSWSAFSQFHGSSYDNAFYQERQGFSFRNNSAFGHLMNLGYVEDWGVAVAPVNDLHSGTAPMGLTTSTWAYGIPATIAPEKREAALQLLAWLTAEEEGAGWFARFQGRPSPILYFNSHPDYRENPYWHVAIEAANHSIVTPPVNFGGAQNQLMAVVRGEIHPQQGLANAELELQLRLDEYWEILERE